jgi:hypothetical protein
MIAPFATLAFLTVLWITAFAFAEMFGRSGSRILAALRAETPSSVPAVTVAVRMRPTRAATPRRPLHAQPQLRAAA